MPKNPKFKAHLALADYAIRSDIDPV